MNLVLFIHKDSSKKGTTLKKIIEIRFNDVNIRVLQTYSTLEGRLKKVSGSVDSEIFVLLAESGNRLTKLTALIKLLENRRIVLIIPDESKAIVSCASQFFPRFFTSVSNNYDDLCSVLNKMISQTKINKDN